MPDRPHEHELLAWIEGDLAPERRPEVEALLASDPALRARLLEMSQDMRALRSLSDVRAPQGLIRDALDAAARDALFEPVGAERSSVLARLIAPSRMALAAALFLVVGGATLAVWVNTRPAPIPAEGRIASTVPGPDDVAATFSTESARSSAEILDATPALAALADASAPMRANRVSPDDAAYAARGRHAFAMASENDVFIPADAGVRVALAMATSEPFTPVHEMPRGGMLPLLSAVRAIDEANIDWSLHDERFLSLMVAGRERMMPRRAERTVPVVTPSSYEDALRLATLGRLSVRIRSVDPADVERALATFAARRPGQVVLRSNADARGDMRFQLEMDRTEADFGALLSALQAAGVRTQAFLDVSLIPTSPGPGPAWTDPPRQISSRGPRVNIPISIERADARE